MTVAGMPVEVPDGTLAAWRLGPDMDPEASIDPVIAIHGITATSRAWLAVAAALDGRARLVAPDLRGRGASCAVGPPDGLDAHVGDVLALLDHLGLHRAVIAGHSLGAWVACRLAVAHPDRVARLVLVDGGLPQPGAEAVRDPEATIAETLGPVIERLRTPFADRGAYRAWWRAHPAFAHSDVDPELLDAYADFDLGGEPPQMRCTVRPEVVRVDGRDVLTARDAERLTVDAVHLRAPRGFLDDPHPLQPTPTVEAWAAARAGRRAVLVPGANHYTIAMGAAGARVIADEILAALAREDGGPAIA